VRNVRLGIGKTHFETGRVEDALVVLDGLVGEHADSDATPEALYLHGVSSYKASGDPSGLKKAYERLAAEYPASEWTRRAYPYRLL